MKKPVVAGLLLCGLSLPGPALAQVPDPNLMREVSAIRAEVARSSAALRQYSWTEETDILVKDDMKSSTSLLCSYNDMGVLVKTPAGPAKEEKGGPGAVSKRPMVRMKADMEDYIGRAVSLIKAYVPPKPDQMQYLLENGYAYLGKSEGGKSEIRFKRYYQDGDSLVYTYDSATKVLLKINIESNLGSPKDPVTVEAIFERLPDGVNHMATTTLIAKAKKVRINTRNTKYKKTGN
jgi:hypothetical protein